MSGRLIKDKRIENKLQNIIEEQPLVIKGYLKSFSNKTSATKNVYLNHVVNFCNYLKTNFDIDVNHIESIKNMNYLHITSYMDYVKNYSPDGMIKNKEAGSCAAVFYAIKHFCKYLKLCRYIEYNPCEEVEVPKDKKTHDIVSLSSEEINLIKKNINKGVGSSMARAKQAKWKNRDLCIILLGITTGLRVSAITNIDINDIDFEEKTIKTIEKGNYERYIYLSDKMIELITIWIKDRNKLLTNNNCDALFISAKQQRIGVNTIRDMLKKYTYNIDKKITPHKLRSTAATNLYDATGDIYLVADVLGHHNIQNTKRYARVSTEKREFAAQTLSKLI